MADAHDVAGEAPAGSAPPIDGGNYEIMRRRLASQGEALGQKLEKLNEARKRAFGSTELAVLANERVRTENNCVPRDIVNVRGTLLFGYEVFVGLRRETTVSDVFSLHRFVENADGNHDLSQLPLTEGGGFLADPSFQKDFADLFRYYRDAKLLRLAVTDTRLLAVFQIGATVSDVRVLRWSIDAGGNVVYLDARGDRDIAPPLRYGFEWTATTREDQRKGRFPHLSILDLIFVETIGGDFTIKVENNTETGAGVYSDPVDDANQSVDDAEIVYARIGVLILLKVKPFREDRHRYYVFNTRTGTALRVDAIGHGCHELPESHGIVFPGGYVLATGEHKLFPDAVEGLEHERTVRSPNGEDVLYVYHRRADGLYALYPYNLIEKRMQPPILCHGASFFSDGRLLVFRSASQEPSRVHPMQVWRTPFTSAEHAASAPTDGSFLAKIGNAELVRGISDAFSIRRLVDKSDPDRTTYEEIVAAVTRAADAYHWLGHAEAMDLRATLSELKHTAELVIDEFEKVVAMKRRSVEAFAEAKTALEGIVTGSRPEDMRTVEAYMQALVGLRRERGRLVSLREIRYVDLAAVDTLDTLAVEHFERVSRGCVEFLLGPEALVPLAGEIDRIAEGVASLARVVDAKPLGEKLEAVNEGLTLLSEVVAGLSVEDRVARSRILEAISDVFGRSNRTRALLEARRRDLAAAEGRSEFAAQMKLLGQNVASAISLAATPDACDAELARVMVQLEELEARFGELEHFVAEIATKREEVYDAFGAKRQALVDERQRRAEALTTAAARILDGIGRRTRNLASIDELNGYFASDPMVEKVRNIAGQLRSIGDSVRADEVESKVKAARQDAMRALRDKLDLFSAGEGLVRFGRHRFSVNEQPLELTIVPRDGAMYLHLTGTDFYEKVEDPALNAARELWDQRLVSETDAVYRGEYLAASILFDAEESKGSLTISALHDAERSDEGLIGIVRAYANERYDEGYERGVHDADAAAILGRLLALRDSAGLLRFPSEVRALACWFWADLDDADRRARLARNAQSLGRLRHAFGDTPSVRAFADELAEMLASFAERHGIACTEAEAELGGRYLAEELAAERPAFVASADAERLREHLYGQLELAGVRRAFDDDLRALEADPRARHALVTAWVEASVRKAPALAHATREATVLVLTDRKLARTVSQALTSADVPGLVGHHGRIAGGTMSLRLDEFLVRLADFAFRRVPAFRAYRATRHAVLERERERLRLDELKPKPMTSFVRNRLIDEVYLPLVGANLAKQIGAAGDGKRTDLMGMLLLVSPPGYGKTTLMEYIASRLGLVFVKVNGPAIGHAVTSLDPAEAPSATARQEVEKISLALEMGNNVMLYLDDIQHTSAELLQKFISLCDAQRRIEGIWKGRTRTYDLRGKKFCVVMAGNPYTETGEKFRIPDMLANRADTYNLGEILDGKREAFELSYLENSLTSSPALAPLAMRDPADVGRVLRMAKGEQVPSTELSHAYSAAELGELVAVVQRLFRVRDVLLKVNATYIASASQEDAYRTEPPFKLQGSYRNMNKLAEKVVAVMNDEEVERLVDDHYQSESQTLTTGAEQNLLKLAELRGRLDAASSGRWAEIKREYVRRRTMGGAGETDPVTRVTGSLAVLGRELEGIRDALASTRERPGSRDPSP